MVTEPGVRPQHGARGGRSTGPGAARAGGGSRAGGWGHWPQPMARSKGQTVTGQRDEQGITTAEYAVGTAAGAGLAGVLYQLVTGGYGDQMLRRMFDHVMGMLGIG